MGGIFSPRPQALHRRRSISSDTHYPHAAAFFFFSVSGDKPVTPSQSRELFLPQATPRLATATPSSPFRGLAFARAIRIAAPPQRLRERDSLPLPLKLPTPPLAARSLLLIVMSAL